MGRRENPIGACGKSLQALASWLRARRESTGLTYTRLAERTRYSGDTLTRAASGGSVPKLAVVLAFAEACGTDLAEAERLWKRARREALAEDARGKREAVHIHVIDNFADLHAALLALYAKDGCRPYRELSERVGGFGRLPHATVGRVLNRKSPPRRDFVLTFAQACGVRGAALEAWGQAWDRADSRRRPSGRPSPHAATSSAGTVHSSQGVSARLDGTRAPSAPTGRGKARTLPAAVAYEEQRASSRQRPGVPCVGCGQLVTTHSDMAARWGEHVWCVSCGHDLQVVPWLVRWPGQNREGQSPHNRKPRTEVRDSSEGQLSLMDVLGGV
ncbi:helix-turn-helix domain-containing protein [Kitasatospora sp. NPDC098663]|uniref:helix-turn-helix domain-containing protein n=1 Tax=Kitasatospora sp. NPDC098663 TaxID=3364096 RepID=UPI003811C843